MPAVTGRAVPHRVDDKPLVWLHGEIKSPPFSAEGQVRALLALGASPRDVGKAFSAMIASAKAG